MIWFTSCLGAAGASCWPYIPASLAADWAKFLCTSAAAASSYKWYIMTSSINSHIILISNQWIYSSKKWLKKNVILIQYAPFQTK